MKTRHSGPKLTATMGQRLSEHARRVFDEIDLRRDVSSVATAEQLRSFLRARKLPAYDAVLELEETASGFKFWPGTALGVQSAIQAMEAGGERLSADRLERVDGRVALPILYCGDLSYWMDERGRLHFVDLCPPVSTYDSFLQFVEHHAFVAERREVGQTRTKEGWHCVHTSSRVGPELSARLEAPSFEPATGERLRLWWRDPLVIEEQLFGQFGEWTRAYTPSASDAAAALIAMHEVAPGMVSWSGPDAARHRGRAQLFHRIDGTSEGGQAEIYEVWERAGACWIVRAGQP